jgi:hypothetical protein
MNRNVHNIILSLGMIAPGVFFILMYIIFPSLYPEYNSTNQHISQLGAIDSPIRFYANFFGFYLFGISLILFSLAVFKLPKLTAGHKTSSILLLITGVVISLIAFFPCDVKCVPISKIGVTHLVLAGIQLLFLISTVIIFSLSKPLKCKASKYVKFMFLLWIIPSSFWFVNVLFNFHGESVGLIQRISLAMTYFFVVIQGIVYSQYYKDFRLK